MKKIVLAALAATTALIATPASAQTVTGTITLTGSVAPKCLVVPGGGSTFADSVAFGELASTTGTLRAGLSAEFDAAVDDFQVVCTTANPEVSVTANALATAAPAAAGYDNSIDYDAHVQFSLVSGGPTTVTDDSGVAGATGATLGARLANATNIHITADNFRTNAATDILVASPTYSGTISISIAPGV